MPDDTAAAPLADKLPRVSFNPLLPPDRDDRRYEELLQHGLVFWQDLRVVMVTRYDLATYVLGHPELFSSGNAIPSMTTGRPPAVQAALAGAEPEGRMMVNTDGADHEELRRPFERAFGAYRIGINQHRICHRARVLLRELVDRGHAELRADYARPLVAGVANDFFGFPNSDADLIADFCRAATDLLDPFAPEPDQLASAALLPRYREYIDRLIFKVREYPQNDLLTDLVREHLTGAITRAELVYTLFASRVAAEDTTVHLVLNAVQALLHTGVWADIARAPERRRPGLIDRAIHETLRAHSPHCGLMRITTTRTELAGHSLPAGVPLVVMLGAANVDPAKFRHPERFDPFRRNRRDHIAFGHGAHVCVGEHLARTEARIALQELFRALPDLELAEFDRAPRVSSLFFNGPQALRVTWKPTTYTRPPTES